MKKLLLLLSLFCSFFSWNSFSQSVIENALVQPTLLENGDRAFNSIDPNGARQGEWFFKDVHGVICLKEKYVDNQLVDQFVQTSTNETTNWVSLSDLNASNEITINFQEALSQNVKAIIRNWDDKQLFMGNFNGRLFTYFLGNWSSSEVTTCENTIIITLKNYVDANTNNFKFFLD